MQYKSLMVYILSYNQCRQLDHIVRCYRHDFSFLHEGIIEIMDIRVKLKMFHMNDALERV